MQTASTKQTPPTLWETEGLEPERKRKKTSVPPFQRCLVCFPLVCSTLFTTQHKNSLTKGGRNEVVFTRIHFWEIAYRQTVLISRDALTHNKRRRRTQVQLLGGRSVPKRSRAKDLVAKNRAEGKSFVVCRPPLSTQQILAQLLPSPPNPQKGSSRVVGELVGGEKDRKSGQRIPRLLRSPEKPSQVKESEIFVSLCLTRLCHCCSNFNSTGVHNFSSTGRVFWKFSIFPPPTFFCPL